MPVRSPHLHVTERAPLIEGPAAGRTVLFVHGVMDRSTSFNRLAARLPDWTVLAYDRRGYGRSGAVAPSDRFDDQVDDLLRVLEGAGDRAVVALGHSYGGDVVLAAMARRTGAIEATVVWEPPQPWLEWWPRDSASRGAGSELAPEERAEWFMRRMVGDRVWERLPAATKAHRRSEGKVLEADLRSLAAGPPFDPAAIAARVVAGRGGESRPHQRRSVRELATALPDCELVEIAGAQHTAHLSHPAELASFIRRVAGVADLPPSE